jgi:hypothetical protein
MSVGDEPDAPTFDHGTKADLRPGDLIEPGYSSNYGTRNKARYVYFSVKRLGIEAIEE